MQDVIAADWDFIVVGAGSAGSVIADRLSADAANRVLVIEAGGWDREPLYRLPLLGGKMYAYRRNNWYYHSEPQQHCAGRRIFLPRGKMIGGTFNINGIVYMRGNRADFEQWSQLGNRGWSFAEVLPYFKRSESYKEAPNFFHGTDGGLPVAACAEPNVTSRLWVEAGVQAGHPRCADPNGAVQDGFGLNHHNVWHGRRVTTAKAFLHPALRRPNLAVLTRALVWRVVIEGGRATGVEIEQGGRRAVVRARREIVLSAGAVNTPQILMLSGVGAADELRGFGLEVVRDLPGVGHNLQDHYNVTIGHKALKPVTLARDLRLDRLTWNVLRAFVARKGPVAVSPIEAGAFLSVEPGSASPDVQVAFTSIYPEYAHPWMPGLTRPAVHSVGACLWPNRPFSRGRIALASADPRAKALLDPQYLSDPRDLAITRAGIREIRRVLAQPAFQGVLDAEFAPGAAVVDDAALDAFIRDTGASGHHLCGSAKMGSDSMAVVDDQLRVHGVAGLRVADASVMPTMVSGNTNATTIMIGEKASDLVLGRALPAEEVETRPMPQPALRAV
jgi:choline dehydrogenase